MEDRYKRGKIYKIVCNTTGLQYIGSTCEPTLARRLAKHKGTYNEYLQNEKRYMTSFEILKNNNCSIILVEDCPCERKEQLLQRERYWIDNTECVNKIRPIISIDERKEQMKEYYQENREQILEKDKEYKKKNSERYKEYRKEHYEENREQILEQVKVYRQEHRERYKEYFRNRYQENREINQEKIVCDCGAVYRRDGKSQHLITKKHQLYCEQIQQSQSL